MSELSRLRGSEGYAACDDATAGAGQSQFSLRAPASRKNPSGSPPPSSVMGVSGGEGLGVRANGPNLLGPAP
jgi:hypothetical protein